MRDLAVVVVLALVGCGGGGKPAGTTGGGETGGSGGDEPTGGSTGGAPAVKKDAAPPDTGGSGGAGLPGDTGGAPGPDAAIAADSGGGVDAAGGASDAGPVLGGGVLAFYEAEAVPPNTLISGAVVGKCGMATPACPPPGEIKPEMTCCSGSGEVRQLLRGKGGLQFNGVTVDAEGIYDVTWWYHCGNNDNFHDPTCRGEPHTASGCRPGEVTVNGVALPKIYEFPCFPGSWGQIHAATTTVPLKAGANTIKMTAHYTNNDAIDIDAIAIYAAGKGVPPSLPKSGTPGVVAK